MRLRRIVLESGVTLRMIRADGGLNFEVWTMDGQCLVIPTSAVEALKNDFLASEGAGIDFVWEDAADERPIGVRS